MIIPIFNGIEDTVEFLRSLSKINYSNYEVIIVDDGSTDGSSEVIKKLYPSVIIINGNSNLWWAGGTNLGIRHALGRDTDFILTINNDNEVSPNFLDALVETALQNPDGIIKSVGYDYNDRSKIIFFGGDICWRKCFISELMVDMKSSERIVEVPLANGNSTLFPAGIFKKIGFYDEKNCPQYHADAEILLRARKFGFRVLVDTESAIFNKPEQSVGRSAVDTMSFFELLRDRRSPYYFKAILKIYREYCPYRFFPYFLFIGYAHLLRCVVKRNK